jgi:hypothetical protein
VITPQQYNLIRQAKLNGLSQRATAARYNIHRSTVKKYWDGAVIPQTNFREIKEQKEYQERKEYAQKLIIEYVNKTNNLVKNKQRMTSKLIYEEISKTIQISYPTTCRYINDLDLRPHEIFIPLEFDPGEVMQVDWCTMHVDVNGIRYSGKLFCAVLGYSGKLFTILMPNEKQEALFYSHVAAFNYFNGVPKLVFYDNCTTIVDEGTGRLAKTNKKFDLLQAHYGFEARFMNASRGNEKGLVENLCQHSRKIAYTPIPQGNSLKEIQESTLLKVNQYNNTHRKRYKDKSIKEMYEIESRHLHPLPAKEFQGYNEKSVNVDKSSMFTYDTSKYSVPNKYVNKKISLQLSPYEILCWYNGKLIASHTRSLYEYQKIFIVEHYVDILTKKIRAIEHAQPLKQGHMPYEIELFRSKCKEKNYLEQVVKIMLLCRDFNKDKVLMAVSEANKLPNPTFNSVINFLKLQSLEYSSIEILNQINNADEIDNLINSDNNILRFDALIPDATHFNIEEDDI